jgi:hypothetical protein
MSDIPALSGAYSVDALDDIERAHFERHLRDCNTCTSEVQSLREASALLAETSMVAPSAALRARVLAEIATVRPLPPIVTTAAEAAPGRRRRFPALVAAAAAVIALGAGAVITQPWDSSSQTQVSAADRILRAPDAEAYVDTIGGTEVTLVRSVRENGVVIVPTGMEPAPPGKAYALWLQHDNKMVLAGIMGDSDEPVVLAGDAVTATGGAVSIEDAGEQPTNPSAEVAALFDFKA